MSIMKRILPIFMALLLFTACGSGKADAKVIEAKDGLLVLSVNTTGGSIEDVLASLSEAGELTYSGSTSDYGLYLTAVNGREAGEAEYWAVYTTLGDYEGVSYSNNEFGTYDYNGTVCASASYGVSGLPAVAGELYVLVVASY